MFLNPYQYLKLKQLFQNVHQKSHVILSESQGKKRCSVDVYLEYIINLKPRMYMSRMLILRFSKNLDIQL